MDTQESSPGVPRRISPIVAVFIILQIFFIIFLIATIHNITQENEVGRDDKPKTIIENLSAEAEDLPDSYVEDIERSLTETMEQNLGSIDTANTTIKIRDGSLKVQKFDNYGFRALSMVVDIPSLQQSYQIFYKYPIDHTESTSSAYFNNPRAVLCLDETTEILYPDFKCKAAYPKETRYKIAADYLRYFDFNYFSTSVDEDDPTTIRINPAEYSITDEQKESYIQETKDAIESLGISSELFKYKIITPSDLNYRIYD